MSEEISKAEKQAVLRNDVAVRKEAATYFERAQAEIGGEMGRFKSLNKQTLVGASGGPVYPRLPPSSPFASDPVPAELDLGFSVDEMVAVGTEAEIARSIADEAAKMAPTESSPVVRDSVASSAPLKRRA